MYEILILLLLVADQITKIKIKEYLETAKSIPVIGHYFYLTYVENRGAAFGILQGKQVIFIIIALLVTAAGLYYIHKKAKSRITKISISLIIAGAIGNVIDRIRLGYVIDFFDFRFIWNYVFNFADICVVAGTVLLFIALLMDKEESKNEE